MAKTVSLQMAQERRNGNTNGYIGKLTKLFEKVAPFLEDAFLWPKFRLGTLVITAGAEEALEPADIIDAIASHGFCRFGDLCRLDIESNLNALRYQGRIVSRYHSREGTRFYVITEWNRSVTTVLLPDEY